MSAHPDTCECNLLIYGGQVVVAPPPTSDRSQHYGAAWCWIPQGLGCQNDPCYCCGRGLAKCPSCERQTAGQVERVARIRGHYGASDAAVTAMRKRYEGG